MMITPNKIKYGTCPYCKLELNDIGWIPFACFSNFAYYESICPNKKCGKKIRVNVRLEMECSIEKGEEYDG